MCLFSCDVQIQICVCFPVMYKYKYVFVFLLRVQNKYVENQMMCDVFFLKSWKITYDVLVFPIFQKDNALKMAGRTWWCMCFLVCAYGTRPKAENNSWLIFSIFSIGRTIVDLQIIMFSPPFSKHDDACIFWCVHMVHGCVYVYYVPYCVACCVLRVACCVLRVAFCVLRVACCVLRVGRWWCASIVRVCVCACLGVCTCVTSHTRVSWHIPVTCIVCYALRVVCCLMRVVCCVLCVACCVLCGVCFCLCVWMYGCVACCMHVCDMTYLCVVYCVLGRSSFCVLRVACCVLCVDSWLFVFACVHAFVCVAWVCVRLCHYDMTYLCVVYCVLGRSSFCVLCVVCCVLCVVCCVLCVVCSVLCVVCCV